MNVKIQGALLNITAENATLQGKKVAAGRFHLAPDWDRASFVEEKGARVICGERNSHRLLQGNNCSVWWNSKKKRYTIRVSMTPDMCGAIFAECDFEECLNYVKSRIHDGE